MKKLLLIIIIVALAITQMISIAAPAMAAEQQSVELITENFDKAINDIIVSGKAKGAVASLIIDGNITLRKGYGYANEALDTKADGVYSGFRVGSLSKTFVAVAALIAIEENIIDMNEDISFYLGDFPEFDYSITMQHLLTHTAGFEEIITGMAVKNVSDTEPLSVTMRKYRPEQIHKPGEIASYSNYGIGLAAYVIEKATGEDFSKFAEEKIFAPLEMTRTTFEYMHDKVNVSHAYMPRGKETLDMYMNIYPEGSAVSTADDMAKYMQWLIGDEEKIISNDSKAMLFERQFAMADELGGIGYVWNRFSRNGREYYSKKGETLHFYSRIALYPEQKSGLFLSFNTYVPSTDIDKIIAVVTDSLLGEKQAVTAVGRATIDIDGCYANTWSSFKTAEKLLRFIVPGKMADISGSFSQGYTLNGERITHIGNNTYDTPMGKLKFFVKEDKVHMATDYSQTYIKINGLENKQVTIIVTLSFLASAIILMIASFASPKRKSVLTGLLAFVQIISFTSLAGILFWGIMNFAILSCQLYINISAWVIVAVSIINILNAIFKKKPLRYLHIHNLISIAFSLVMLNMNLLV